MNKKRYLAFDLEIAEEIPTGKDWREVAPLGITCAAVGNDRYQEVWSTQGDRMDVHQCRDLAEHLIQQAYSEFTIVTWNGLGFDFPVLAMECNSPDHVDGLVGVALDHIDMGFTMACERGYMIGLNKAAKGLKLPGKTEGMHGDLAPQMWKQGHDARVKVIEYLKQDVVTTFQVFVEAYTRGEIPWISGRGNPMFWECGTTPLSVVESLDLPEPDTSWMTNPRPRRSYYGWTGIK